MKKENRREREREEGHYFGMLNSTFSNKLNRFRE